MHNLQNRKVRKVTVHHMTEIFQLIHLKVLAKLYILMTTGQMQKETERKHFTGSRQSLKHTAS